MGEGKPSPKPPPIMIFKKIDLIFLKQLVNSLPRGPKSDKLPNDSEQFTSKTNLQKTQTPKKNSNQNIGCVDSMYHNNANPQCWVK